MKADFTKDIVFSINLEIFKAVVKSAFCTAQSSGKFVLSVAVQTTTITWSLTSRRIKNPIELGFRKAYWGGGDENLYAMYGSTYKRIFTYMMYISFLVSEALKQVYSCRESEVIIDFMPYHLIDNNARLLFVAVLQFEHVLHVRSDEVTLINSSNPA